MSMTPAEEAKILTGICPILPVGTATGIVPFAQTFPRWLATGVAFAPTSTTLTIAGIWLPAGQTVTGITFVSGATAESGGSHLWYCLYKGNFPVNATAYALMAQSSDDTGATSFAANTAFRKALTAAQVCPYTGFYYVGFCATGTIPTLAVYTCGSVNLTGNITGMTPILAGTADTTLGASAPAALGAVTAITTLLYAFVD